MYTLEDAIRIEAPPRVVFDQLKTFLTDSRHFKQWHRAHECVEWMRGEPLTTGAVCYAEEFLGGRLRRLRLRFTRVVENRHVAFRPTFPLSLFLPGSVFDLEPLDEGRATLLRSSGRLASSEQLLLRLHLEKTADLEATRRHLHEEALALKEAAEAA